MQPKRVGFAAVAALFLLPAVVRADGFPGLRGEGTAFGVAWGPAGLVGPTRGLYGQQTVRGVRAHLRTGLADRWALGLLGSWNGFPQGPNDESGVTSYAAMLTLHRYFSSDEVQPFVAVGLGGARRSWVLKGFDQGTDYSGAADGQLGILWTIDRGAAIELAAHYQYQHTRRFFGDALGRFMFAGVTVGVSLY